MLRNVLAILLLLTCGVVAGVDRRPQRENQTRISVEYDLRFTPPGKDESRVQVTLSGGAGKTVSTTLEGMDQCKIEIETSAVQGGETQYVTSLKLVGAENTDSKSIRFCPKLMAATDADAGIQIGPYQFRATVRHLK